VSADFFVLGSGSFTPGREGAKSVRNPSGYALRIKGELLLFDLGFGDLRQLNRCGLSPDDADRAFFTHRHPDHVGDLAALLFHYRYDGRPRGGKLRLYGPRGFKAFVDRVVKAYHPWLSPRGYDMTVSELEEAAVVRGVGWSVLCREVPHTTESLAYRFESKQGVLCYTVDTAFDKGLAGFAAGADLLVVECSLRDDQRSEGHLRVSEALELARLSGARRTLLTHLTPASERAALARLRGRRGIVPAKDLMRVKLK
jgi:ribonuclease BN (tRNA processing enzyme)